MHDKQGKYQKQLMHKYEDEEVQRKRKQKRQELEERLRRLENNSKDLMGRIDKKIDVMSKIQKDLDKKENEIDYLSVRFNNALKNMALGLFGEQNPLKVTCQTQSEYFPEKKSMKYCVERVKKVGRVVILTGAGISVGSGIPTFRGTGGLYQKSFEIDGKKLKPQQFISLKVFKEHPQNIWSWCDNFRELVSSKEPCLAHHLIDQLANKLCLSGKRVQIVTTNIDGYHQKAQTTTKYRIHEIHGNIFNILCVKCQKKHQNEAPGNRIKFQCQCKGKEARPYIMFFDEQYGDIFGKQIMNEFLENEAKEDKKYIFEMVIAIGTSLQTGMSIKIVSSSAQVIEINPKPIIEVGRVYPFEQDSTTILSQMIKQL